MGSESLFTKTYAFVDLKTNISVWTVYQAPRWFLFCKISLLSAKQ